MSELDVHGTPPPLPSLPAPTVGVQLQLQRQPEVYILAEAWVAGWRKFLHGRSMSESHLPTQCHCFLVTPPPSPNLSGDLPPGPIDNRPLLLAKGNSLQLTRSKWLVLHPLHNIAMAI